MKLSAKIFLENGDEFVLGPGRLELLRAVRDLGSLRKAALHLGMSYRWAWGRLNNVEKELQLSLLTRTDAPIGGRPKVLTQKALELITWFESVEAVLRKNLQDAEINMPDFLRALPPAPARQTKKRTRTTLD